MPNDAHTLATMMTALGAQYPAIGRQGITAFAEPGPWYAETYPPWESESPLPGQPAIGVRPMGLALRPPDLQNLLGGESLHILGSVNPETDQPADPGWLGLKHEFLNSLTPQQLTQDRFAYRDPDRDPEGTDTRHFGDWMQQSQLDAYLRPGVFPMAEGTDPSWYMTYTPDQLRMLQAMHTYLKH